MPTPPWPDPPPVPVPEPARPAPPALPPLPDLPAAPPFEPSPDPHPAAIERNATIHATSEVFVGVTLRQGEAAAQLLPRSPRCSANDAWE